MKKLYSLLLAIAALFITTNMRAQVPTEGTQLYDANRHMFAECYSVEIVGKATNCHMQIIGLDQFNQKDTISAKGIMGYNNCTSLVVPGVITQTSGTTTIKYIFDRVKANAYENHEKLETLRITGVTGQTITIQGSAFKNCTALKSIEFGYRTQIELLGYSFMGCTSLNTVTFPSEAPTNGIKLFAGCFEGCTSLDLCNVNLDGVTEIWSHAFKNTATGSTPENNFLALNNVKKLGADILQGTQGSNLKYLQFELIDATLGTTASKATESPFYSLRKQIEYIDMTGGSVTGLGDYLFWGMENTEIDGWGSVRTFGKHCMENCEQLSEFSLSLDNAITIGDSAFMGITSSKVYLPAGVPGMGKNVFGAMSDGFTLFIINTTTCDDELAELYMMEDENENLWTPYQEGRLMQKGTKSAPGHGDRRIDNATETSSYSQKGSFSGRVEREPVCGWENFVYRIYPTARYYALDDAKDTIQCFPLSHIEYNGNKYYPDNNELVTIPLASDASQKIIPVFMPKLITEVNIQVGTPQVGDPANGSAVEVILPEGALYKIKSVTLFDSTGTLLPSSLETLEANTGYQVRVILQPDFVRAAFPWESTNRPDKSKITTLINGTAADKVVAWNDGTIGIIRYFTTSDTPHAINNVEAGKEATKILRNGQLIIIRDGKEFNAQGAQL